MSVLSRPVAAKFVARFMQAGISAGSKSIARKSAARFPEFPSRREELAVPTSMGPTRVTVYRPETSDALPAVYVNLHGGGYVLAERELDDPLCRAIAAQAGVVVLNVDYVVAPQHPFPDPSRQIQDVVHWVVEHGAEHGWDGTRLAIGGQSAGGALAAASARMALEEHGPAIALQVLHYAPLDLTIPAGEKTSPLRKPMLRPWMGEVFDTAYAPDPAVRADRLISPAGVADSADLTGIAPAVVITAGNDILLAEGKRYADRLAGFGALLEYHEVPGADHGYDGSDDALALAAYTLIAGHVRRAVGVTTT